MTRNRRKVEAALDRILLSSCLTTIRLNREAGKVVDVGVWSWFVETTGKELGEALVESDLRTAEEFVLPEQTR